MNDEKRASRLLPFRLRRGATGNDNEQHPNKPHADLELRALLREWEAPSVSRGAEARLLAAFRDEAQRRPSLWQSLLAARVSVPIPLAACVVVALMLLASALATREPRILLAAPNMPAPIQTLRIVETPGPERVVTRVVYVAEHERRQHQRSAPMLAAEKRARDDAPAPEGGEASNYFTHVNMKEFQPAEEMKLRVIRKGAGDEK
jgi:hypothetical protein